MKDNYKAQLCANRKSHRKKPDYQSATREIDFRKAPQYVPGREEDGGCLMDISASSDQRSPVRVTRNGTRKAPRMKPVPTTSAKYMSPARMVLCMNSGPPRG